MISVDLTRRILSELALALPDDGYDVLTSLEVRRIWGDVVLVRLQGGACPRDRATELRGSFEGAVGRALGDQRHRFEISWNSPNPSG